MFVHLFCVVLALCTCNAFQLDWYLGRDCTDALLGTTKVVQGHGACHTKKPVNVQSVLIKPAGSSTKKGDHIHFDHMSLTD